ncbi:unnamed protein product [marine sediment metagenome]|uniref:Uncharacterized protein n=1 Tax=marine sediment metagenome TaxID=412755 RepID=X1FMK6_9ZZZZ
MSYSQYERGEYIRLNMIYHLLLDGGAGKINAEQFGTTWDLIDEMETAGTTHNEQLTQDEYYKKAVRAWVDAKKIQRQRIAESKSI